MVIDRETIKTRVERECDGFVKVKYSDKPEWLIIKSFIENKTMASIRFGIANITLNIDTKAGVSLDEWFGKTEGLAITTTLKANHIQNRINIEHDYYGLIPIILTLAYKSNMCHLNTDKDRRPLEN